MADEWQYWRDALAGKNVAVHADQPQSGFYKARLVRNGEWQPVAIWLKDGAHICRVGSKTEDAARIWTFCAGHPVTKEDAKHAFEHGTWPGDAPEIGHNSGDMSLAEEIAQYAEMAFDFLKREGVKDKVTSDKAANYRAKLNDLKKQADQARLAEKEPHARAAKEVDDKWREPISTAGDAAESLRSALTAFMRAEEERLRKEQEEAHRKAVAAAEAERKRVEAERAEKLRVDPIAALTDPEPELPMAPPPPEAVRVQAGGQRGRKTGLRTVTRYVVSDFEKALNFFKDSDDVRDLIAKLAERAGKAGVNVPGVEKVEDKVAA